ncbi:condensation domain-containing protein [Streptomyces albus]|uniref:condensation domain-containing protein n=1 Tax=Streptomyces sp. NRRL F-5917 TaxID=1463873 RepID=UPI0004C1EC9C|nr:condensation domain-containing protein [Streptomyces sp. NRRL F-5917]
MTSSATRRENDLWLLETLVPKTAVNNLSVVFEVTGRLSAGILHRALDDVVRRHRALRTVARVGERGLELDVREDVEITLDVHRVEDEPAVGEERLRRCIAQPFALEGGPLLRAALFSGTERDTVCLVAHHLVFDAMSGGVVLQDLVTAYEARAAGASLPDTFAEGLWLPEREPSAESLEFWKRHLDGYRADGLGLWCDKDGDPAVTLAGDVHHHVLSPEADAAVTRLRRALRAPKAVVLLSAYYLTLALHGAGPDLVVGVPASTRDTASQQAVGYHVNMLPLRSRLGADRTVREVATEVRAAFFEALAHPDVPAETFLPQDRGDRPAWRNTLFRHVFNYVPTDFRNTFTLAGLPAVQRLVENGTSKYDLEFFASESADTALLSVLFNTQVLDAADVTALVARYDELLARLPEELDTPVGRLSCWSGADRSAVPAAEPADGPDSLYEAVRRTAESAPERIAVRTRAGDLDYAALWRHVTAEQAPALDDERAAGAVTALRALRQDTGAAPAEGEASGAPAATVARRVAATAVGLARAVGAGPGTTVRWAAPAGSPESTTELFLALACGGTAAGTDDAKDAAVLLCTPHQAADLPGAAGPLTGRKVLVAGEPLPPAVAARLLAEGAEVHTGYRPEGEPHWVAVRRVTTAEDAQRMGGQPLAGAAPSVTGPDARPLPPGLRGRLALADEGAPRLTAQTARWRTDGTLEVFGATPARRAELALLERPEVAAAAAAPVPAPDGSDTAVLTAWVVAADGPGRDDRALADLLLAHCAATLPAAAVPEALVTVEALPLKDGHPDRERLAAEHTGRPADGGEGSGEPAADEELTASLVRVWGEFLDTAGLDADANFFTEGGHSLLGAQLVQRVKKATGAALRLADLFANPTPRAFAALLSGPEHRVTGPVV